MATKTYVVTSAQYDANIHKTFLGGLEQYCAERDAELIIIPMKGRHYLEDELDRRLDDHSILTRDRMLNKKLKVAKFGVLPQNIEPTTGQARFAQSDHSTIFESPKQRMKVIANSNVKMPKILMTTGAVTRPRYNTNNGRGVKAKKDHVYGAIVVEITGDKKYHFRQLNATNNGHFVDLGQHYKGSTLKEKAELEALVLGDWHTGDTNTLVREATFEMIETLSPKRVLLHDFFNGHSVNHHEQNNIISLAQLARMGKHNLESELKVCYDELHNIAARAPEIIILASNHDEFLDRYLKEGRFLKDPQNVYVAAKILPKAIDGEQILKAGLELFGKLPRNVTFLRRDEDYKVRSWQLGSHGDKGANGSRGSMRSKENAYGKSITGHSHTPEIMRNTYVVGTSTDLKLPYTIGPSSWMNTHGLLYSNGKVQLVNIIEGNWRG